MALVLLIASHSFSGPEGARKKPSFIWFNPDEMRAESAYGEVAMPNLDRLASGGVRFTQCHTSHTTCSQSRAAFMTGWPTHISGHRSLWSLVRDAKPKVLRYLHDVLWWDKNTSRRSRPTIVRCTPPRSRAPHHISAKPTAHTVDGTECAESSTSQLAVRSTSWVGVPATSRRAPLTQWPSGAAGACCLDGVLCTNRRI